MVMSFSRKDQDVLQQNYASISEAILYPIEVPGFLIQEGIVSRQPASEVIGKSSLSERVALLMRAVTAAVAANSGQLRVFIAVLKRFPEAAKVAWKMTNETKNGK